jgi:hypothetical protein
MVACSNSHFQQRYESQLKHLKLEGLQPKTIKAYARALRRIGAYFDYQIDDLCEQQLVDYFTDLLASHSWSAVKLDLYGLGPLRAHHEPENRRCGSLTPGPSGLDTRDRPAPPRARRKIFSTPRRLPR